MKKLNALVIDDERLARKELISMLAEFDNVSVLGEADDVPSAIDFIHTHHPNVLFLDIQMPGKTGFDLINEINYKGDVVFVTAYDEYALRAFEVNAMDYLLKPITQKRLEKSIERISKGEKPALPVKKILNYDDRLFINVGTNMKFLKISSIVTITAEGDYSEVFSNDSKKGLVLKSMKEWEERLPSSFFCRIHRSVLINMEYAEKIEKWFNYSYRIKMKGIDEPFILSRRYAKKLKEMMS